jgi:hypothetical protein
MTLHSLQALTWGTVTGAVVSALLLASAESAWPELSRWRRGEAQPPTSQPAPAARKERPARTEPTRRSSGTQPAAR